MRTGECVCVIRRISSVVVLTLTILASPASAQKADRPEVKVGDEWLFVAYDALRPAKPSPNRVWVVTSVTPAGIEGTENGKPLMLTPDLNVLDSPRRNDSDRRLLSFPLEVGKQWSFVDDYLWKDRGAKGRGDGTVRVVGHEKLRVHAGKFETFKIEATIPFRVPPDGPVTGVTTVTYWYAPKARAIVKEETLDPHRGMYGVELVKFKLKP
jgi:hypothetical protein